MNPVGSVVRAISTCSLREGRCSGIERLGRGVDTIGEPSVFGGTDVRSFPFCRELLSDHGPAMTTSISDPASRSQKSLAIDDPGGSEHPHARERHRNRKCSLCPGYRPGGGTAPSRQKSSGITSAAGESSRYPGEAQIEDDRDETARLGDEFWRNGRLRERTPCQHHNIQKQETDARLLS